MELVDNIRTLVYTNVLTKIDVLNTNNGSNLLYWSSIYGYYDITKLLIDKFDLTKIDIMIPNKNGKIALHGACSRNHLAIVLLLIDKGNLTKKDIMICNNYSKSSYDVATFETKMYLQKMCYIEDINDMIYDIVQYI